MEDWQKSLDGYMTTEPDSGFTEYFEAVCDALHRDVQRWDERYGYSPTESNLFSCIVEKCFDAGMEPHNCAGIILNAFILFARFPAGDAVTVTRSVMQKVYCLRDAEDWFLENRNSDGVICVKNGEEKICKTYSEAILFFA